MSDSSSIIQNQNLGTTPNQTLKTDQKSLKFSYDYFDAIIHSLAWWFMKSKNRLVTDKRNYSQRGAKLVYDVNRFKNDWDIIEIITDIKLMKRTVNQLVKCNQELSHSIEDIQSCF